LSFAIAVLKEIDFVPYSYRTPFGKLAVDW
jgi:hypothetical protein